MRIVLTVNMAWNAWNFRRALLAALVADGHAVTVLAPADETVPRIEALGCAFRALPMERKGLNPLAELSLIARMRREFAALRADVVLGFTVKNNIYGALAARSLGIRFIPNVTGLGTAFLSGGALESVAGALYRVAFAGLDPVFFQNDDDRALFAARGWVRPDRARLLPGSGIDLDHFAAAPYPPAHAPDAGPVFLMIARLLRDKGVGEYLAAARQLRSALPGARFRLLGKFDPDNRSGIAQSVIEAAVAEGVIEYCPPVDDVRSAIAAADCVVLPSYREGAPRTLIEAAAMARPLIASDVPGCRAVVADGVNGLLCAARDADALAAAMRRFAALPPDGRAAMAAASRDRVEREYGVAVVIAAYRAALAQAG